MLDGQTIHLFSRRAIFSGNLKKPREVLLGKESYGMACWWEEDADGLWVTGGYQLSQDFSPISWYPRFHTRADVPPDFPFYTDVLSPDATPHSASCKMIIPERKNSALWSLPCHEKLLWQTLQRLNKATRSITQRQPTDSDLCQRAGWGWWFLFFLLLSWQQVGREDVYD